MKIHSIKIKITLLYTGIVTLLFCLVLGGAYASSKYYSEKSIKEELRDEVKDFCEVLLENPERLKNTDRMTFFDDHILLSIYDEGQHYIDGVLHDELPEKVQFQEGKIQVFHDDENSLYVYDTKIVLLENEVIWVRGIHTFDALTVLFKRLVVLSAILLPLLIFLTALIGYHMIKRSLNPVSSINQTVNEIISSSDLSMRLEMPEEDNEMYSLTETFNHLLNYLEQQFLREQQFTSDAAHELRTPLAVIMSRCEYCLEELELPEEVRGEVFAIHEKATRMSGLINHLLMIARAENQRYQPNVEEVDLEILIESVMEEIVEKAQKKQIELKLKNETKNSLICADMEMMMRMMVNLIDNGISYGKAQGFVEVVLKQDAPWMVIEVRDNGIGISEHHLEKIWNRFYQADESHTSEGFGLGLFMVKYIVKCHKGDIKVRSEVGKGTVFTVKIPMGDCVSK